MKYSFLKNNRGTLLMKEKTDEINKIDGDMKFITGVNFESVL